MISCPCALVISIPLGYFGGIGIAAKRGILIKGSNYIDALNNVKTVVFDKTGTLTKGSFSVTEVVSRNGFKKDEILEYAALAEAHSGHPIAHSIKKAYTGQIDENRILKFKNYSGLGVETKIKKHRIIVGNDHFLHIKHIDHEDCHIQETVAYVVIDNLYAGYIKISDELKEDAEKAVSELKKQGINNVVMLTGDSKDVAEYYSKKLGIDQYYAELLPEEKVDKLDEIMESENKGKVAFVGDGINDAPVIARADIGIAMGRQGSDAAIETADVVFMTDSPSKTSEVISISRRTRRIVLENIILALGIKLAFIFLGTLGFAGMWEAVFADVGVTLLAVFNTLRILRT